MEPTTVLARLFLILAIGTLIAAGPSAMASGHGSPAKKGAETKKAAKKGSASHGASSATSSTADDKAAAHAADVDQILSLIAAKEQKHDPHEYVERDLGEFRVTHPGVQNDEIFLIKFHLYAVIHQRDDTKFTAALEGRQQRMRDAVLSLVHKARYEQLVDPALDGVKADLIRAINRVLENDDLRDVAFSTFSMERS